MSTLKKTNPMRRFAALSALVFVVGAGCSASDGNGDDGESGSSESPVAVEPEASPTAHLEVAAPFELGVQPPEGFVLEEGDRHALVAEDHVTYELALDGGHANSRIYVTTYLLPEDVETGDYDAQVAVILGYDETRGNTISADKHNPTLVSGYQGVYRFASYSLSGDEVSQQNHYLFADRHLIQVTCQWQYDFNQVYEGCRRLVEAFPYPEEWPLAY